MKILGVRYDNVTVHDGIRKLVDMLGREPKASVFFLNLDCLRIARQDPEYRGILSGANTVLPDGIGLAVSTFFHGGRMKQNCNGTDFVPLFLRAAGEAHAVFLLGGQEGVGEAAADALRKKIPAIRIVETASGFFQDPGAMVERINASGADILLVGMGSPRQEKWIARHRATLSPKMCIGVGGLLDWMSGRNRRAPLFFRKLHCEWLWRVIIEPRRLFKRYFIDGVGFLAWISLQGIGSTFFPARKEGAGPDTERTA